MAEKIGLAPLINTSFLDETVSDLFTEQVLLCGGVPALMVGTFNMLKKKGISEEVAVQECLQELSYIIDVIKEKGLAGFQARTEQQLCTKSCRPARVLL